MGKAIGHPDLAKGLNQPVGDLPEARFVGSTEDGLRYQFERDATLREWNARYEELVNAPDADCPGCGVQPCQFHREGCPEFERIKAENE